MTTDDVKARLVTEIALRGSDDRYIDRNEEREILQIAIQLGVGFDAAKADMSAVCGERGYVLESDVVRAVGERLAESAGPTGKLDRAGFERVCGEAARLVRGMKPEREVRRLVVTVMEDTGRNRVKTGGFGNWSAAVTKERGGG